MVDAFLFLFCFSIYGCSLSYSTLFCIQTSSSSTYKLGLACALFMTWYPEASKSTGNDALCVMGNVGGTGKLKDAVTRCFEKLRRVNTRLRSGPFIARWSGPAIGKLRQTYRNLQRHRAVFPAMARLSCRPAP